MIRVTAVLFIAAVIVGIVDWRKGWPLLKKWGLMSNTVVAYQNQTYFEPMGISYKTVMQGFERTFEMRETTDMFVERRQPRYIGVDVASRASLEILGEKADIGRARLTVWMPRVMLSMETVHTQRALGKMLMMRFLLNTMPGTHPTTWLDGFVSAYNEGEDISTVEVYEGRKLVLGTDPMMREMLVLIVTKE